MSGRYFNRSIIVKFLKKCSFPHVIPDLIGDPGHTLDSRFRGNDFFRGFIVLFFMTICLLQSCGEGAGCSGFFKSSKEGVPVMIEKVRVKETSPVVTVNGRLIPKEKAEISFPNSVIVQDVNDNYFAMGSTAGSEASGGTIGTGTAKGDLNGYQLQFTAEEALPAPFVASDDALITFTSV